MTGYIRRKFRPSMIRWIVRSGIFAAAFLCLSLGAAYTAFLPQESALPRTIRMLLELPLFAGRGELIPGLMWTVTGTLGLLALRWRQVERLWWFACLNAFTVWAFMYFGGVAIGNTRDWVTGVLFLAVGFIIAILWWSLDMLRLMGVRLATAPAAAQ